MGGAPDREDALDGERDGAIKSNVVHHDGPDRRLG